MSGADLRTTAAGVTLESERVGAAPTLQLPRRILRSPRAVIGGVIVCAFIVAGSFAPLIAPYGYAQQDLLHTFEPPLAAGHLLGTDQLGRDILSRILEGVRISLLVGFVMTIGSLLFGGAMGIAAGYFKGKLDTAIRAIVDVTWGFPLILVAVLLVGALGPGIEAMMLAVGLINWAGFSRIIRSEVRSLREREFVDAARALGKHDLKIIARHIVPHLVPAILVMGSYYVALAIIFESSFSFIGIGVQPPLPSLGQMIGEGRSYILTTQWLTTIPGVTIAILVIGLNMLGDGLRDIFDPRLKDK